MRLALLVLCLLATTFAAGEQPSAPPPRISAQQFSVADQVILAGVPIMDELLKLPAESTIVVDLRTAAEGIAEEAATLKANGYAYHHVPVAGAKIDPDQLAALGDIAAASSAKTLIVHCRSANRAAMLWGAHLLEQDQTLDETLSRVGPALTHEANRAALLAFFDERQAAQRQAANRPATDIQ